MKPARPKPRGVRCAIYTRKSTDEGLEQSFNSLDAQREAGEAFVASQKHEGWVVLPERFDDGGYSGGSMERPGLRRLLAEVDAGKVDVIVVYKVDRLSRSLLDFARIIGRLDEQKVAFVSVTQQFNTSTPMGKLTLNVLMSFAEFERGVISERTRDKMSAARRKGKWTGGPPLLGYDIHPDGGRLLGNEAEAAQGRRSRATTARSTCFGMEMELTAWGAASGLGIEQLRAQPTLSRRVRLSVARSARLLGCLDHVVVLD